MKWSRAGRKEGTEYQVHLTQKQQQGSSTERELVGMREGLKLYLEELQGSEVKWTCDNKAVSVICRVGSMRPRLQDLAMDIWRVGVSVGGILGWYIKSLKLGHGGLLVLQVWFAWRGAGA